MRTILIKLMTLAFVLVSASMTAPFIVGSVSATTGRGASGDIRSYKLAPGDRITVTVFDQVEFSGDFLIDGAGKIHMPLVGAIPVGRTTIEECQQRLTERLGEGFLKNPRVSVRISELRPIHVLGDVRAAGSYQFRFGQSAFSAVALAGGVGSSEVRQSAAMADLFAGEERVKVLEWTRQSLVVRLARLEAERVGKSTFEVAQIGDVARSSDLAALRQIGDVAGSFDIAAMLREEREQLAAGLRAHERTITLLRRQKPRLQAEIDATREQIKSETPLLRLTQARLNEYGKLSKLGLSRAMTELELQRQVAQHEGRISRLNAELARLKVNIGDLDIRVQEAENARLLRMMNELRETRLRLREIEVSLPAAREVLELRRQQVGLFADPAGVRRSYRIFLTRGEGGGLHPVVVEEGMMLEPGDILEVRQLRSGIMVEPGDMLEVHRVAEIRDRLRRDDGKLQSERQSFHAPTEELYP